MNSLRTIHKLPQQELEIWEGGRVRMPTWITGEFGLTFNAAFPKFK
jgi:hypothetical protein